MSWQHLCSMTTSAQARRPNIKPILGFVHLDMSWESLFLSLFVQPADFSTQIFFRPKLAITVSISLPWFPTYVLWLPRPGVFVSCSGEQCALNALQLRTAPDSDESNATLGSCGWWLGGDKLWGCGDGLEAGATGQGEGSGGGSERRFGSAQNRANACKVSLRLSVQHGGKGWANSTWE